MSPLDHMDGMGYEKVDLREVNNESLRQIGNGTNPFLILPVIREGEFVGGESRVFRKFDGDLYEITNGKGTVLNRYRRYLEKQKGEQVH